MIKYFVASIFILLSGTSVFAGPRYCNSRSDYLTSCENKNLYSDGHSKGSNGTSRQGSSKGGKSGPSKGTGTSNGTPTRNTAERPSTPNTPSAPNPTGTPTPHSDPGTPNTPTSPDNPGNPGHEGKEKHHNNGFGNGDQDAPGRSLNHNNAENSQGDCDHGRGDHGHKK